MKYKVGDRVKIKEDLVAGRQYDDDTTFTDEMSQYKGKTAVITRIDIFEQFYEIDLDNGEWAWIDEMFEDVKDVKDTKEVDDNTQVRTVDVGFHLDYCGHKVLENVWQGGWADECKERSVFFTTYDSKNQYTLPLSAIDWVIPHED